MKRKILLTGSTGMMGSRFLDLYKEKYEITTIGRRDSDINISLIDKNSVEKVFMQTPGDLVLNFAGYTDVQKAQEENGNYQGEAYTINTLLPKWLAHASKLSQKKLYHISTNYVFDGKKTEPYTEEDDPSPLDSWYSKTKYWSEVKIKEEMDEHVIVRTMFPYNGLFKKSDIAKIIVESLRQKKIFFAITDQKIQPTLVDEISKALALLIDKEALGIYNAVGNFENGYTTPFDFANSIAGIFGLDKNLIKPQTLKEFSQGKAPIPQNSLLSTQKIEALGMKFMDEIQALNLFKQQLISLN